MIISLDEVIAALDERWSNRSDTSAKQALALTLVAGPRKIKESVTYHTAAGGLLVVDLDDQGRALSIELV